VTASARPRRVEEIGDESRRRILDAAEELFAERGYERTSLVDVAERSGISRGSIPWHFTNKEGLLVAVVRRALDRYVHPGPEAGESADDVVRTLERVKAWMRHPTASMFYTVLAEALSDGPLRSSFVEFQRREQANLAEILGRPPSTLSRAECEELAVLFNGAFIGLHLQWTFDPEIDLDAGIDTLGRLMRRTVIDAAQRKRGSRR
jgi:TetR/AcrR family transcriptional regulator, acrAB operon repressor